MKFSWEWILDHIKLDITADEAADLLSLRGLTVDEVIKEDDDIIFDIDITTNRPDAMNVRGIARELSAITGVDLESFDVNYHEQTKPAREFASVSIEDSEACHRFCAKVIKNAQNGPTPEWMAKRLEASGMRSINLLVDITNFVLLELGHPLHGYDLNLVPNGKLVVRRAHDKEKLTLIDGTERELDANDLVIADSKNAVGLAGIMGGDDTEINERTVDILLECAWFEPTAVRATAKKHIINTEASYRFERGMGHDDIPRVLDRACHLYQKLAKAEICKEMLDEYPTPVPPKAVTMNQARLCQFAGMEISKDKVGAIFSALGFTAAFKETFWRVEIPSRRVDITREADLFEEVIRIVGYDQIPATLPHVAPQVKPRNKLHEIIDSTQNGLLSAGFTEVINYDFIDPDDNEFFAPADAGKPINVVNPIAAPQMVTMRQSLAPSLMGNISHNFKHGNSCLSIFEIARVFHEVEGKPVEKTCLCMAQDGAAPGQQWYEKAKPADFFELKGVMQYLFTRLGLSDILLQDGSVAFLDPAARVDVIKGGEIIGWLGRVSEETQSRYDLPYPVYLAQINLEAVAGDVNVDYRFSRSSRYPGVNRDLSFTVPAAGSDKALSYDAIKSDVLATGIEEIVDVQLIDLYEGKETSGEQSMTIRVVFQSYDRTLTQDEVEAFNVKVKNSLEALGVNFR